MIPDKEIQEAFEKWDDNKEPYYINEACEKINEGKSELLDIIEKISEDSFHAGRESREAEIKELKLEHGVTKLQVHGLKSEYKYHKAEIKRWREALESISNFGITIPGDQRDKQTMKNIAKEALRGVSDA